MRYLLDTNVLSELRRKNPDPRVLEFFAATDGNDHFVSVLTIAEMRRGANMQRNRGNPIADQIDLWIDRVQEEYQERLLVVDMGVSSVWARIAADRSRPVVDTLLAATALVHNLVFVTRNVRDLAGLDVRILNPWDEPISPN